MFSIEPMSWTGLAVVLLTGSIVGLERQLKGKPIGVRTSSLICLGTYVFVKMGMSVIDGLGDPSRVVGQVVTGVGFLGAGVILSKGGVISGVTSAASIWVMAAIGVVVGLEYYVVAVVIAVFQVVILVGVDLLEDSLRLVGEKLTGRKFTEDDTSD